MNLSNPSWSGGGTMNSATSTTTTSMILLVNSTQFLLSSNSIQDLTISFVSLFLCLFLIGISMIFMIHYLCVCSVYTFREYSNMRKLKKQGNASRSYYESLIPYNGSVKFFETSQPILFIVSSFSILVWTIGTLLYYNLIRMHWYGPEDATNQVGSFTTRRIYCIFTYIWFHYLWGSNLWGIVLLARLFSLFVYNVRFDLKSRKNSNAKKQYYSLVMILLIGSVTMCIGVVHSIFMKFNTQPNYSYNTSSSVSNNSSSRNNNDTINNSSNNNINSGSIGYEDLLNSPIVCNRLNSIPSSDSSISQYDPNTIALVFLQYLILGGIALLWILNCCVYFKQCLCCAWKNEFPNILFKRLEFYIYLITFLFYFLDVTQFNVVSFLYGFDQVSIEDIPLGIRYSNVLAIPILEIILFFGVNAHVLFRFYCICCCGNKEYIRSYKTYEDKQLSCNIVLDTTRSRNTSKLLFTGTTVSSNSHMTLNDSSTNSCGACTARHMTHVMTELDEYFKRPTNMKTTLSSIATHNVSPPPVALTTTTTTVSSREGTNVMYSPMNSTSRTNSSHSLHSTQPILTTHYIPSRNIYVSSPKNNRNSLKSEPLPYHGLENSGKTSSMKSNRSSIRSSSSKKSSDSRVHFLE